MNESELRDLAGDDPRLRRVHEDLVAAGRPPDLPPAGMRPPWRPRRTLPRRPLAAALVAATALAASVGVGYLVGAGSDPEPFRTAVVVDMRPTEGAPRASAALRVGERDEAGNWPMTMTVRGLPPLPTGDSYELVLTRRGAVAASCGRFVVQGESTDVYLNAPYKLREYDGWAVTRAGDDEFLLVSSRG